MVASRMRHGKNRRPKAARAIGAMGIREGKADIVIAPLKDIANILRSEEKNMYKND